MKEIGAMLDDRFKLLGLSDLDFNEEIPEDYQTLEENASQKAWYINKRFGRDCFADDTGLEVEALNGEPGVYSARYSRIGWPTFNEMSPTAGNIRKLLLKLEEESNRNARFRTVIALVMDGKEYSFEGIVKGVIARTPSGGHGFGYDPVFIPEGYSQTFAEMESDLKNRISHRARAIRAFTEFLKAI